MRLIDADALSKALDDRVDAINENRRKGATLPTIAWFSGMASAENIVEAQPTVDAIPVSFIKEQIDKLQGLADYEFIESGGYLGECNHELRALQDLLKHWKGRKEE